MDSSFCGSLYIWLFVVLPGAGLTKELLGKRQITGKDQHVPRQ
jgi:hypothetical protein